jgi:hypothetical protein
MARNPRAIVLLAILVILVAAFAYKRLYLDTSAPATVSDLASVSRDVAAPRLAAGNQGGDSPRRGASGPRVPSVALAELAAPRPAPGASARNLFRFKPKAPPAPPPLTPAQQRAAASAGPPPPPPVPPIPLRLRGIIQASERGLKLAVWTDNNGNTFSGKEGDILDGRYRIVKIGVESADIAWADGRGRPERKTMGGQ